MKKKPVFKLDREESDLEQIKQKAAYEGLPYQTLIASILHQYAAGHLGSLS